MAEEITAFRERYRALLNDNDARRRRIYGLIVDNLSVTEDESDGLVTFVPKIRRCQHANVMISLSPTITNCKDPRIVDAIEKLNQTAQLANQRFNYVQQEIRLDIIEANRHLLSIVRSFGRRAKRYYRKAYRIQHVQPEYEEAE